MSTPAENVVIDTAANADATAQPSDDAAPAAAGDPVATPETPEEKARVQERINQLTRERYEARARAENESRERQRLQQELERLRSEAKPQQVAPAKLPTLEEHGYDEGKYAEALLAHLRGQQQTPDIKAAIAEVLAEQRQQEQQQARGNTWRQREADFIKSKPDFVEKVYRQPSEGGPTITESMMEVIAESDVGPALAYHLAENPEVSAQIARLSPIAQARELGRIEARLEAPKAQPAAKPPVSQAPPPAPTVAVADSPRAVSTTDPASDKFYSDDAGYAAENKRMARKAARK